MIIETLNNLWHKKKRCLSERLQSGISDLAEILQPVARETSYSQEIRDNEIQWINENNEKEILFFHISDPRDLQQVSRAFQTTKDEDCILSCIFVHQWMDGEGNWDVFGLHPQRGLVHWNRFWGYRGMRNDLEPALRDDMYNLFSNRKEFPALNRKAWAKMLDESKDKTTSQLSLLAEKHGCVQIADDDIIEWKNDNGFSEAMFFIHQNFPSIDDYIDIFRQIKLNNVPVSFLFQKAQPGIFDIFRFSARSYIEHNNQAK